MTAFPPLTPELGPQLVVGALPLPRVVILPMLAFSALERSPGCEQRPMRPERAARH